MEVSGSELIVLNKNGDELWRKNTGFDNLQTNDYYLPRFQKKAAPNSAPLRGLPISFIRDINKDGKPEILFSIQTVDEKSPILVCYDYKGRELWTFRGGKEMKFGSTIYYSDYVIKGFDVYDFDNDGLDEIFLLSIHRPDWPTQLVILDYQGKKLGEYWNSGQLNDYLVVDINDDAKKEIILVGVNNEYRKGCLIVLDPREVSGGSPQTNDEFRCQDLDRGSELYYVLFPRTDADLAKNGLEYESISSIRQVNSMVIRLNTYASDIFFYLDRRLVVQDISFSHRFVGLHRDMKRAGLIGSILNEAYERTLIDEVLYFDGQSWTQKSGSCRKKAT